MNSARQTEHFVTLFDSHYLPQGLCLHRSLEQHGQPFHLWAVALDEACAAALERIGPAGMTVVRLSEVENDATRSVKVGRSVAEYCWTLTPFLPSFVFRRAPGIERVTYLDADVYFFQPPALLIDELLRSGKHVLITEHAFAPEYAANLRYGRFCVQFVTFRNTEPAKDVLAWWQDRCIEWCYAREEDGKFGDQKYLDRWPEMFPQAVQVLARTERTAAPWNVAHLSRVHGAARPVLYHFHSLKVVSRSKVVLYYMYVIGPKNRWIYDEYVSAIRAAARTMRRLGIGIIGRPLPGRMSGLGTFVRAMVRGQADWASF